MMRLNRNLVGYVVNNNDSLSPTVVTAVKLAGKT